MSKQSPIPDALDKPFYDACNEERLVVSIAPIALGISSRRGQRVPVVGTTPRWSGGS